MLNVLFNANTRMNSKTVGKRVCVCVRVSECMRLNVDDVTRTDRATDGDGAPLHSQQKKTIHHRHV